jgi:hypothetical protein
MHSATDLSKQKLQDRLDIQALTIRYANALDRGDIEAWLESWADDGIWEGAVGRYEGKQRLAQLPVDLGARIQGKRHVMSNFVLSGEGDEREQRVYMLIFDKASSANLLATGSYVDIVKKINGQWKFAHRTLDLAFTAEAAEPLR